MLLLKNMLYPHFMDESKLHFAFFIEDNLLCWYVNITGTNVHVLDSSQTSMET